MKKKAICIILMLNLIFVPCYQSYADAGTITIAGGTIGVGGLTGGALAGLAGPAVVAVFVGMMAVGIDVELTKQSEQAGMTKTQFVKSKIEQYCQEAGTTADVFYKGITNGTSVLKDGSLAYTQSVATTMKQFINWLYNNNMVNAPTQAGTADQVTISGQNFPIVDRSRYSGGTYYYNMPVACCMNARGDSVIAFNRDSGLRGGTNATTQTGNPKGPYNGYYYIDIGSTSNALNPTFPSISTNNVIAFLESLDGTFNMTAEPTADGFTGDRDEWNEKSGVFDPVNDWPTVVNPGVVGQIPIPADTDITVNVRDYLDSLQEVLDKLTDRVIEGVDNADGIPKDWDIPDAVEADPTIGKNPPIPDTDETPISDDTPVNPTTEPSLATEPLKFDLRNIFPFCIPFDLKDMFSLLQAEPVAPRYTVNWDLPFVQENFTFTIDLEPWSDVAVILRKMELLAFVIGLALITRNLIRG